MQLIGLTGGIASGKSTACQFISSKAIPVIDADKLAHEAYTPGSKTHHQICLLFPTAVKDNGEIDRAIIAKIVFNDRKLRRRLEMIIHPHVIFQMIKHLLLFWCLGTERVVLEIPLIFETGLFRWMSYNVLIYTAEELQIQRLELRNQYSKEDASQRINAQMKMSEKCKLADIIIRNEGSLEELYSEIEKHILCRKPSFLVHKIIYFAFPIFLLVAVAVFLIQRLLEIIYKSISYQ